MTLEMTPPEVGVCLKRLGNYRTKRTQQVALQGPPRRDQWRHVACAWSA